ncbi:hypothetical protein HY031_01290 [Candidatus Gottesmanbacteria bacterium]|nr:hypothetical protein [Candidatus Gottesmanbacteria bacterium]
MPVKTKRQKLLADKHRQFIASSSSFTIPAVYPPSPIASPSPIPKVTSQTVEFTLERRDMIRTIFLGLAAIGIEFGMYWYSLVKR